MQSTDNKLVICAICGSAAIVAPFEGRRVWPRMNTFQAFLHSCLEGCYSDPSRSPLLPTASGSIVCFLFWHICMFRLSSFLENITCACDILGQGLLHMPFRLSLMMNVAFGFLAWTSLPSLRNAAAETPHLKPPSASQPPWVSVQAARGCGICVHCYDGLL